MQEPKITRRRALEALGAMSLSPLALAQEGPYPSKPIRIIVPIAAGTATDAGARYLANELAKVLGTTVIVENKVGADGMIGTEFVAKSAPDGYTLLSTFAIHYIHQWMAKVSYDAVRDFEPVARYGQTAVVLVVAANSPMRSVKDVIEAAKQKPEQLSYASAASTSTMAAALMENMTGTKLRMIPYKSSPQTVVDVAANIVDLTFAGIAAAMPLIQSGRVRALAVTTGKRSVNLPDIPTMAESGLAGYDFSSPNWILAPRGTPAPIVNKLSEALVRVASAPEFKEFARTKGFDVDVQNAAAAKAGAAAELEKWGRLVEMTNVKGN